jgi:uncharacterized protein YjbI with pentapeptide repeats
MADPKHLELLKQGVDAWNAWREKEPSVHPNLAQANLIEVDLRRANLCGVNLSGANLSGANLSKADLSGANLSRANLNSAKLWGTKLNDTMLRRAFISRADLDGANLRGADLREAQLYEVDLSRANLNEANLNEAHLSGANLSGATLGGANLSRADLSGTDLSYAQLNKAKLLGANLRRATLVETDLTNADLTGCDVYGISAWDLKISEDTRQDNLAITHQVATDHIELAQFLYLMLQNERLRGIIDTITSKVVLILGRFTPERKAVLDALRDELRSRSYVPVVFDFDKPRNQTTVETVTLLARMARFVIADLTDAKSVLQELQAIVPNSPMLPVQPIIIAAQQEPGMFDFIAGFPWVMKTYCYNDLARLTADLDERVIRPAEAKVLELRGPQPE